MNIELIKAILHVLDPAVDAPILSEAILPPSEDALQYLAGHAAKCFASDEAKACTLADDSPFLPLLWNIEDDFEKKTAVIAGDWFRVMQENPAIPAGDAAFLLLEIDGAEYLAALKLNYKPGWLHYCRMDGGPAVHTAVMQPPGLVIQLQRGQIFRTVDLQQKKRRVSRGDGRIFLHHTEPVSGNDSRLFFKIILDVP